MLAEGQKLVKREIDVAPGRKLELTLEAAKLTAPVAGGDGLKVRCKSHGEIRIFVDGQDSGRSCPNDERISVAAGPHKIGAYSARTGEMHELDATSRKATTPRAYTSRTNYQGERMRTVLAAIGVLVVLGGAVHAQQPTQKEERTFASSSRSPAPASSASR